MATVIEDARLNDVLLDAQSAISSGFGFELGSVKKRLLQIKRGQDTPKELRRQLFEVISRVNTKIDEVNKEEVARMVSDARNMVEEAQRDLEDGDLSEWPIRKAIRVKDQVSNALKNLRYLESRWYYAVHLSAVSTDMEWVRTEAQPLLDLDGNLAIIKQRQQQKRAEMEEHYRLVAEQAAALQREHDQMRLRELKAGAQEAAPLFGRFWSELQAGAIDRARHTHCLLGAYDEDILNHIRTDHDMQLSRMKHALDGARREMFGHKKVRQL